MGRRTIFPLVSYLFVFLRFPRIEATFPINSTAGLLSHTFNVSQTITIGWFRDDSTDPFHINLVYLSTDDLPIITQKLATAVVTPRDESGIQRGTVSFTPSATGDVQMVMVKTMGGHEEATRFLSGGFLPTGNLPISETDSVSLSVSSNTDGITSASSGSNSEYSSRTHGVNSESPRPMHTLSRIESTHTARGPTRTSSSSQNYPSKPPSNRTNVAGAVVGALGGVAGLLASVLIGIWSSRRRRRDSALALPHLLSPPLPTIRADELPLTSESPTAVGTGSRYLTCSPPTLRADQERTSIHVRPEQGKPLFENGCQQPQPGSSNLNKSLPQIPSEEAQLTQEVLALRLEVLAMRQRLAIIEASGTEDPPDYVSSQTRRS
ncbi:hypothetical protein PM082_009454 [Marasmius tenuissimus]|nr:hypothetical protein PM082_009454 [Marasmius tenuissimus]